MAFLNDKLAEDILSGWQILDAKEHVNDFPIGAPNLDDIAKLVEMAFFASFQKEEAEFVQFSVMFLLTHSDVRPRHTLSEFNEFIRFSTPKELTVEELGKIAGSVDSFSSSLIVEKLDGQFFITGIAPFGRRTSPLNPVAGGYPRPEALTVTVRSPGSFIVSRSNGVIGRFLSGRFEPAQPTALMSKALGGYFLENLKSHIDYKRYGTDYWVNYMSALEHLLVSASIRGHGGTIIWVPSAKRKIASERLSSGRFVSDFKAINKCLSDVLDHERQHRNASTQILNRSHANEKVADIYDATASVALSSYLPDLRMKLTTLLDTLAQMSVVDGALLVDEFFQPLAFGARLQAKQWTGNVNTGPIPGYSGGAKFQKEKFGTRHNSAIDFVADVPGAIGFVISQDGPVRGIMRDHDVVLIWPDCMSTVFVD